MNYRLFWYREALSKWLGSSAKLICIFILQYSEEVLAVFKSYKLDDTQASRKKMEELKTGGEHVYFAKFLTSEKVWNSFFHEAQ